MTTPASVVTSAVYALLVLMHRGGGWANDVKVLANGKILLGGDYWVPGGGNFALYQYNDDGTHSKGHAGVHPYQLLVIRGDHRA